MRQLLLVLAACHGDPLVPGGVPVARGAITVDGELREADWNDRARFATFLAGDAEARPHSQVRLLRDATTLYVGLYAADQDIRSTDAFELALGSLHVRVDARGKVAPPDLVAAVDVEDDETIDDPRDDDEEWTVELAIPIARVPADATSVRATRCDTPKGGAPRCGGWIGPLIVR